MKDKFRTASKEYLKQVKSLNSAKGRRQSGLFMAEGEKICREALSANIKIHSIIAGSGAPDDLMSGILQTKIPVFSCNDEQLKKVSASVSPQPIIAVCHIPEPPKAQAKPFIVCDTVADPGNLGTIIRTADWFGFRQIILGPGCASAYNPKTVRSTMGSLFHLNIINVNNLPEFLSAKFQDCDIFGASLKGSLPINQARPATDTFGIALGSESHGLSDDMMGIINKTFIIPGGGKAESLNVSVAAGITLYHFAEFLG